MGAVPQLSRPSSEVPRGRILCTPAATCPPRHLWGRTPKAKFRSPVMIPIPWSDRFIASPVKQVNVPTRAVPGSLDLPNRQNRRNKPGGSGSTAGAGLGLQNRWASCAPGRRQVRFLYAAAIPFSRQRVLEVASSAGAGAHHGTVSAAAAPAELMAMDPCELVGSKRGD